MSDKTRDLDGTLTKKARKKRRMKNFAASALGFIALAGAGKASRGSVIEALKEYARIPDEAEIVAYSHPDFKRNLERQELAEKYAWDATEEEMRDPKEMRQYIQRLYGLDKEEFTREECLICSILHKPVVRMMSEIYGDFNRDFDKDDNLIYSWIWNESRFNPNTISESNAVNMAQTKEIAVREVVDNIYKRLDKPPKRNRGFVAANKDTLEKYRDMFKDSWEDIFRRLEKPKNMSDIRLGMVTGITYLCRDEFNNDGNTEKAFGSYLLGATGYRETPDEADNYIRKISVIRDVFDNCLELKASMYKNNFATILAGLNNR